MINHYKQEIADLMKADNYAEAFIYCGKAFRENQNDSEIQQIAAFIFKRIQDAHIEIEANTTEEYTLRGIAYLYANQLNSALYDFDCAINKDETYDYAWKCRSFLFFITGNFNEAERNISKAIKLNPIGEYYNDLGNIFAQKDPQNLESLKHYLKAIELSPEVEMYWYNYGVDLAEKGKLTESITAFDQALILNPNYEDAQVNRAHVQSYLENN